MLEDKFRIAALILAQLQNRLTAKEQSELDEWLESSAENRTYFTIFCQDKQMDSNLKDYYTSDRAVLWNKTNLRIQAAKAKGKKNTFHKRYRLFYGMVAACIVLLTCSMLYYYNRKPLSPLKEVSSAAIRPGSATARLTLANGKTIVLTDGLQGEIAKEAGVTISKTTDGMIIYQIDAGASAPTSSFNTLTTGFGETYQITLPDGTKVWLNAGSSLRYPTRFVGDNRQVDLTGEGYFEVASYRQSKVTNGKTGQQHIPFVVRTHDQQIEVLGTRFNVNSYTDEASIKTTLLEGSVRVTASKSTASLLLHPGQQARLSGSRLTRHDIEAEEAIAWKNGDFVFNDSDFETTMRKIARWYNVEIVYETTVPTDLLPGGWISRNKDLTAVLEIIAATGRVHFEIQGRKIIVSR